MTEDQIVVAFREIVGGNTLLALGTLIVLNFALGIVVALKDGKFTFLELADILKKVWPYVGGALVLLASGNAVGGSVGLVLTGLANLAAIPFGIGVLKKSADLGILGKTLGKVARSKPIMPPELPGGPPSFAALDKLLDDAKANNWTIDQIKEEAKKRGIPLA